MMNHYIYSQSTGFIWGANAKFLGKGYSGYGEARDDPHREDERGLGPIPRGFYVIGPPYDSARVGPLAIPLTAHGHDCHGRSNFLFHGDSVSRPGKASRGCIVVAREIRNKIAKGNIRLLLVIE